MDSVVSFLAEKTIADWAVLVCAIYTLVGSSRWLLNRMRKEQ
jgi:hypothetical protein